MQKENCHLLQECFQSLFPLPPLEQTKEGEAADDAEHAEVAVNPPLLLCMFRAAPYHALNAGRAEALDSG